MTPSDDAHVKPGGADASARGIHPTIAAAVKRLTEAGARDEGLGRETAPRRVLGLPLRGRIAREGRVWRLGVVLLSREGELFATGDTLRAHAEVRRGYTAESARERASRSAAARRGGFAEGETVNVGWERIDLARPEGGLVRVHGGVPQVRWNPRDAQAWVGLAPYLNDRIELLLAPHGS